jgi:hypothetical protein
MRETLELWGYVILCGSISVALFTLHSALLSKFIPPIGIEALDLFREDYYYCALIPLTVPVFLLWWFLRFICLELFKNN